MATLRNLAVLLLGALQLQPAAVLAAPSTKQVVPGKYIVRLKSGISTRDVESHIDWVRDVHRRSLGSRDIGIAGVKKTFHINEFNAYAGEFDEETLAQIRSNPDVLGIEESHIFTLVDGPGVGAAATAFGEQKREMVRRDINGKEHGNEKRALVTQDDTVWGLSAISHRAPGNGSQYIYDDSAGAGTWAYVIDSGIRTTHEQFSGGRAVLGYNVLAGTPDDDNLGHGTHVAGTIAGATVGIAKKASVVAVKAFDASVATMTEDILDAIDWAVNDIVSKGREDKAVINMSLVGGSSDALNDAVNSAFAAGILSVVAAGNTNDDAGTWSPASAPDALTVAAMNATWSRWWSSSYGSVVDLFAPGSGVISAAITSDTALVADSGTSMAAPHVAGVALYLQALAGGSRAAEVSARVKELAVPDVIEDPKGSPNFMLYNGSGA
ncbi:hypothetical protein SLS62_009954 [Diatrype stigma]|uniref:Uncharacterized protein n=1 Tax=Diatrype stigma TaxID=117547 RepID=A0AAN9UEY1_9PEZI